MTDLPFDTPLPLDPQDPLGPLGPEASARLELAGEEFLAEILGRETLQRPDNLEALVELTEVLARLGRTEEGLRSDQRLVKLAPEHPTAHYNLACSLSLLGRIHEALDVLARAIQLGYDDLDHMLQDEDLENLRSEARFREFAQRLGAR